MSSTVKQQPKQTKSQVRAPKVTNSKAKKLEQNYLQEKKPQGAHLIQTKKESTPRTDSQVLQKPLTNNQVGDSLDQEIQNVGPSLFQSASPPVDSTQHRVSTHPNRKHMTQSEAPIDDSEFYRALNMVDNTKDTLVEKNIKTVLERKLEENPPQRVADKLYEKLPMLREGIYRKDYTEQDLLLSKPRYGDANDPYATFVAVPVSEAINSTNRRDFIPKSKVPGEPVHRDVTLSQQDIVKHLRPPAPGESLYRVVNSYKGRFSILGRRPSTRIHLASEPKDSCRRNAFHRKINLK